MDTETGRLEPLSRADWLILAEAVALLGLARLAVLALPFRWVMRAGGRHMAESSKAVAPSDRAQVERVTWAIDTARLFTPWDSNCLAQTLSGARMLQRRGIASTTYLGVAAADPRGLGPHLSAHAWLRAGEDIILGDGRLDDYVSVASFATGGQAEAE